MSHQEGRNHQQEHQKTPFLSHHTNDYPVKLILLPRSMPIMMSTFRMYFELGLEPIADFRGYDHILFLVALCAVCQVKLWGNVNG